MVTVGGSADSQFEERRKQDSSVRVRVDGWYGHRVGNKLGSARLGVEVSGLGAWGCHGTVRHSSGVLCTRRSKASKVVKHLFVELSVNPATILYDTCDHALRVDLQPGDSWTYCRTIVIGKGSVCRAPCLMSLHGWGGDCHHQFYNINIRLAIRIAMKWRLLQFAS